MPTTFRIDAADLGSMVAGEVVLPGDENWDAARQAWNLAADQQPIAVVYPAGPEEVATVVRHAAERGVGVAVQGTGHGAGARAQPLEDAVLLNMARATGVAIDPEQRIARVEAGALWGDVLAAAGEHGLAALAGSSPDVGVVGFVLGGGHSWLSRRHGLACNSVAAFEAVTGDGRIVRADAESEPELFWALRGGGGSFAVVTALELRLLPIAEVHAGSLFWPVELAPQVLGAYVQWVDTLPEEMTSIGRILHLPPVPFLPEEIRGKSFVVVEAAFVGPEADAAAFLQPLRDLAPPAMDTFATMPLAGLVKVHGDPESPVPGVGDHALLADMTAETVHALLGVAGAGSGCPLVSIEMRHLGGALAVSKPDHGALSSLDAKFALYAVGMAPSPEQSAASLDGLATLASALEPWTTGASFPNFADRPDDDRPAYAENVQRRLRAVAETYDPAGVLRPNRPFAPQPSA